jgi:hypothetical protein
MLPFAFTVFTAPMKGTASFGIVVMNAILSGVVVIF